MEVFMTPSKFDEHSRSPWLRSRATALATGLALIVIGFGIVKAPEPSSALSNAAGARAEAAQFSSAVAQARAPHAVSAAHASPAVMPGGQDDWTDGPRACAPDKGIIDACIYN
jgi:hypothetical protein